MKNLQFRFKLHDFARYDYLHKAPLGIGQKLKNEAVQKVAAKIAEDHFSRDVINEALRNRRSDKTDKALINDFLSFEKKRHPVVRDYHYERALRVTESLFRPHRQLSPVAFPDLRYYPQTLPTNVGAPWNLQGFKMNAVHRNVDLESEVPKVSDLGDEDKWNEFFTFIATKGDITVEQYLRYKQRFGLIENDRRIKHNLYPELLVYNRFLVHLIKDKKEPFYKEGKPQTYYWHTLFARAHTVKEDEPDKIRAVFGATFLLLQTELMFVWPLEHCYKLAGDGRMLWNKEIMTGGWRSVIHEFINKKSVHGQQGFWLGLDWSEFDKRVQHEIIDDVHKMWRSWFDFSHYEETSVYNGEQATADPERIEALWDWMCHSIKHTPILLPDGSLYSWTHRGLASGFQQTQLLDSFVNCIMVLTILSAIGIDIEADGFKCLFQGDDSIIATFNCMNKVRSKESIFNELSSLAEYYFDAKLNTKKSEIGSRPSALTLLGYHNRYGIPYRDEVDLLTKMFYPEREMDNFSQLRARAVGLAFANCGTNEAFHRYCEDIIHRTFDDFPSQSWKTNRFFKVMFDWTDEDVKELGSDIPSSLELSARTMYINHVKSKSRQARTWPTENNSQGNFYFLWM